MLSVHSGRGALIAGLLADGISARFTARGSSMVPAIRAGDTVWVEPAKTGDVCVGDVVLVRRRDQLVVHRAVSIEPLVTAGDNLPEFDTGPLELLGRVSRIDRRSAMRHFAGFVRNAPRLFYNRIVRRRGATRVLVALLVLAALGCGDNRRYEGEVSEIHPDHYLETMENRIVVLVRNDADPEVVADRYGLLPAVVIPANGNYAVFAAIIPPKIQALLMQDSEVLSMHNDHYVYADNFPFHMGRIEVPLNTVSTGTGTNTIDINVAVLDTGAGPHSDLNIAGGKRFVSGGPTTKYDDDDGHGTHVSGTIAALDNGVGVTGVAPGASIYAGKVLAAGHGPFDMGGGGSYAEVAEGVDWARGLGVDIISMSLGGPGTDSSTCGDGADVLKDALCLAHDAGITIVVAAGNEDDDAANHTPAAYNGQVITVSAHADLDGIPGGVGTYPATDPNFGDCPFDPTTPDYSFTQADDDIAFFSNWGSTVDIMAPGFCIYSTVPGGYGWSAGTSQATPHVSGAAAVYLYNHPGTAPDDVLAALVERGHTRPCETASNPTGECPDDPDGIQEPLLWLGHTDASFENDSVGDTPYVENTNGSVSPAVTASCTDVNGDNTGQCLDFSTTTSGGGEFTRLEFCLPDTADNYFRASMWIKPTGFIDQNLIGVFGNQRSEMLYWWFLNSSGSLDADDHVGNLTPDVWHKLLISVVRDDSGVGTASMEIDGVGIATAPLSDWGASTTEPMECLVITTWPDQIQDIEVDDVLVTSDD